MAQAKSEFTDVTRLQAEALGEPGNRTFRILVESSGSSATLWLEKEQLFQLALAIQQLIGTLPEGQATTQAAPEQQAPSTLTPLDFKIGRLALGHDGSRALFVLEANDEDDEDDEPATIRVWAKRQQAKEFSDEAIRVCAAGRPLCPLCGGPIDPTGHPCARANGHMRAAGTSL